MKKNRKYMTFVAAAVLSAVVMTGCASDRLEKQLSYRQLGINSMAGGDYAGAIAAFDSALANSSGKIGETELDICYYKAAAQYASGDSAGALKTYNDILAYDKKDANAYYMRGCLQLKNGETKAAQEDFASAAANNPEDYELYIGIYENLAANNLTAEGEAYLNQAFSIKGDDGADMAWRGRIYYLLGEYANAKAELEAALEKECAEANLTLAQVYEAEGDSAAAETYYKAYIDSGKADSAAFQALAEFEMAKENYSEALSYVEQGLSAELQSGNKRELMQDQIICMEYTGDFAGAWTVMQEYITLYPENLTAQREYTFLKNRQGGLSDADAVFGEVVDGTETVPEEEETTGGEEPAAETE